MASNPARKRDYRKFPGRPALAPHARGPGLPPPSMGPVHGSNSHLRTIPRPARSSLQSEQSPWPDQFAAIGGSAGFGCPAGQPKRPFPHRCQGALQGTPIDWCDAVQSHLNLQLGRGSRRTDSEQNNRRVGSRARAPDRPRGKRKKSNRVCRWDPATSARHFGPRTAARHGKRKRL
jgi:hypothetical protein